MDPVAMAPELWRPPASAEGSIMTDHSEGGRRRRQELAPPPPEDEPSRLVSTSCGAARDSTTFATKKRKNIGSCHKNGDLTLDKDATSAIANNDVDPPQKEAPKQEYIHVRARRGQATDSHSLAERARREKISERMKILQDLVPGCNKVIGKASVLDEIINYIQALQRQVEFLSMKLEAVNAHVHSGTEGFPVQVKDFGSQAYSSTPSLALDPQTPREYGQGSASDWLHMQIGGAFERVT